MDSATLFDVNAVGQRLAAWPPGGNQADAGAPRAEIRFLERFCGSGGVV
jgi:hypothetical protein